MVLLAGVAFLFFLTTTKAVEKSNLVEHAKYLGPQTCSSSSCHGGAGDKSIQYNVWSKLDFHSRSYATLTTARSARFAEMLKFVDATTDSRCTVCHAPVHEIPATQRLAGVKVSDGVSCESCHGRAEPWLRTHTRPDLVHSDRVAAGMRDLRNLYARANTCVACHQTVPSDIMAAGHPELFFEMDGQAATQPRHWKESQEHGQIWLVGQIVALREMSWQLAHERKSDRTLETRWSALLWLLQKTKISGASTVLNELALEPNVANFEKAQKVCDSLAREIAELSWTTKSSQEMLTGLANTSIDFNDRNASASILARRAERLVPALDRLLIGSPYKAKADAILNQLFHQIQSLPDFDSGKFASTLQGFASLVATADK